jgi:hypothetical protein
MQVCKQSNQQVQGLHLQLLPQPQPWAVSPDSAAASNCPAFFSGATPRTTVAWAPPVLFSSRSGYILPHLQLEPQLQLDPQLQDIFFKLYKEADEGWLEALMIELGCLMIADSILL